MNTGHPDIEYRYIEPLDVLFLRGNKLFGDPGSYGECIVPPWPSVAAGAIRSRMLMDDGFDISAFANGRAHPILGTPQTPGDFVLTSFQLARKGVDGKVETLYLPPADLIISPSDHGAIQVNQSVPQVVSMASSFRLKRLPVVSQGKKRVKAASGYWLSQSGWEAYLQGRVPGREHLVHSTDLWAVDSRVGIGLEANSRSAESGKLFTVQALAFRKGVGFVAAVSGAVPPASGLLRFGGDGRAASIESVQVTLPQPNYEHIARARRCRIVLTSPGLFPSGWKLPGVDDDDMVDLPGGIVARLVSAAVARADTVSGWDLAGRRPKAAQRIAPIGSVYWLDELQATPEALRKLADSGLWGESCEDPVRRAEGFNRCAIGEW